jgi:hypothetical protein
MNPRVSKVSTADDYYLNLVFTNGEKGVYDCSRLLDFGIFKELKNKCYFSKVRVIDGTVAWPHEQDICPDTLFLESERSHNSYSPINSAYQDAE